MVLGGIAISTLALPAGAQITVDGTLDPAYGSALAVQTVNTGFGDSTVGDGTSNGGSELDAVYGIVTGGNLDVFLSGNFEDNGNHANVFIDDGRAGQSILAVPATGTLQTMNGSAFSPGFQATEAIDLNDYQGTDYIEEYTLTGTPAGGYVGSVPLTGGIGTGSPSGAFQYGFNDTNAAGVNGNAGTAADPVAAQAVTTGLEIQVPLSILGNPTGPILVLADINGGGDSYLSNQFLPGLPVGTGNVGGGGPYTGPSGGTFNFATTPGQFVSVAVPEPTTLSLVGAAAMLLTMRRRGAAKN
jgi:hypothetical protein